MKITREDIARVKRTLYAAKFALENGDDHEAVRVRLLEALDILSIEVHEEERKDDDAP